MGYKFITNTGRSAIFSPVTFAEFAKKQGQTETIAQKLNGVITETLNQAYPIGYIYINTTDTNPHDILGFGTWTEVAQGRTIIGTGDNRNLFGCETMTTTDGAEWAKIMSQTSFFANRAEALECTSGSNWSRLSKINNFISKDGKFEMILKYIYSDGEYASRWQQESAFIEDAYSSQFNDLPAQVPGFNITSSATSYQEGLYNGFGPTFKGLNKEWNYSMVAQGRLRYASAHYPIAQYGNINGDWQGLRGYKGNNTDSQEGLSGAPIRTELWVRCDNIQGIYTLNDIGGESTVTITDVTMWPHNHTTNNTSVKIGNTTKSNSLYDYLKPSTTVSEYALIANGGGQAHNNMSPYLAVSIWCRTA